MLWLLIAYAFAATRNLGTLTRQLGLTTRPTLGGGAFAWVALAMGAASLYFTPGEPALSEQTATHSREGTAAWSAFVIYMSVCTPFAEEIVMRGILYSAFRSSLGVPISIFLVVVVQASFHWSILSKDLINSILLIAGGIILCLLRDRTASLWNCVLFHGIYNASVSSEWPLCIISMGIVLPQCKWQSPSLSSQ